MWSNPQFPENLVTFTEEISNEELHFLCNAKRSKMDPKFHPTNLTLDKYGYGEWYKKNR